ncbi:hypothetical protein M433DRAFT_136326 [Acidomyces richmondensis BFW]|nr:MAG: hypothetical protein FE78DRAFT_153797 [Acidomyces sp. 'richmondensis']KYG43554.1 hypothetical protein M433DRAFT_136326 [Acidomyces richmondensis BFW]
MPSFYSSRQTANQLPLTPPDSTGYDYTNMHYAQDPYAQHQSLMHPRHDSGYEYQGYMQPAVAPAPPAYPFQHSGYQASNSLPPISCHDPLGAPILPPLRINDRYGSDYHRRYEAEQNAREEPPRHAPKEEKATGGVSAKLDYEMERMTDFVTEATQTMYALHMSPDICVADVDVTRSFHHRMQSPPSFRKWVHQVLSATRLPSATILLSMHYLNDRVAHFPETVSAGENQIYRLLAVSLILGSKFLDDNTFVNRSWSDVTAIKVTELNQLEMKWLQLIGYELHVDPEAPNGLKAWLNAWDTYDKQCNAKQSPTRLSPLDTNVLRHSMHRDYRYSPYPSPYSSVSGRSYDRTFEHTSVSARRSQFASTSYNTSDPWGTSMSDRHAYDEFYKRQQRYPTLTELDDVNRRASEERARQYTYSHAAHSSYYPHTTFSTAWEQPAWTASHRYDCNCSACIYAQHYRPYPVSSGYAAQTVMG